MIWSNQVVEVMRGGLEEIGSGEAGRPGGVEEEGEEKALTGRWGCS